jgi:hypothetical protein
MECVECERLEKAFVAARSETKRLLFAGQKTTATSDSLKRLDAEELSALSNYMNHRAEHKL